MGRIYSEIIKTIILPVADKVMKTHLASSYRQIKKMQGYSADEINEWQNNNLLRLVKHAYEHAVYYRNLFKKAEITPSDIKNIEDLCKIPPLTKENIKNNFHDIIPDNISLYPYKRSATGGSTGEPLIYLLDNRSWSMSNANYILNWEKAGYNYGDRYLALGSTSLFINKHKSLKHHFYYLLKNKIALSGINMSDEVCSDYIRLIKKEKIRFIYGYASAIFLLAKFVIENNLTLEIEGCFPTSEILIDLYRETISKAFGCEIVDCYGANDGAINAFSIRDGSYEAGYNCIVRIENPDKEGAGPALITDLFNYSMPLINYKLGDELQMDKTEKTECTYNGQVIKKIIGRTSDVICLENGNKLTGPGFTVLFKDIPVIHYSIRKTGINTIECSIVRSEGFNDSHEEIIRLAFKNQVGIDSVVKIIYTGEILLTESGKRQYFVN